MNIIFNNMVKVYKFMSYCEICDKHSDIRNTHPYSIFTGIRKIDISGTSNDKIYIITNDLDDSIEYKGHPPGKNKRTLLSNNGYTFNLRSKCDNRNTWMAHKECEFNIKVDFETLKPKSIRLRKISYSKDEFKLTWENKLTVVECTSNIEVKQLVKKVDKEFVAFDKYFGYIKDDSSMIRILM